MYNDGYFEGKNGIKLYYQFWIPEDKEPKAVVQIIHGFGEHSGRYKNVVDKLLEHGFAVYANDHQGHGKSEGRRNYVSKFEDYVDDCYSLTKMIKEKHPKLPIFVLGHSMGSLIAQHYGVKYEKEINGIILSGTGKSPKANPVLKLTARILNLITPKMYLPSGIDPNFLSNDPKVVKDYIEDDYVNYKKITIRLGYEMLVSYNRIKNNIKTLQIPFLIQKGAEDNALVGVKELFNEIGSKDKELKIYANAKHEVYNELKEKREEALNDLVKWLEKHI